MSKKPLSPALLDELALVEAMPEEQIDTADIPEAAPGNWRYARRGEFYRPLKRPVTIRLDADVLAWFKDRAANGGYQTEINRVLRDYVSGLAKTGA